MASSLSLWERVAAAKREPDRAKPQEKRRVRAGMPKRLRIPVLIRRFAPPSPREKDSLTTFLETCAKNKKVLPLCLRVS